MQHQPEACASDLGKLNDARMEKVVNCEIIHSDNGVIVLNCNVSFFSIDIGGKVLTNHLKEVISYRSVLLVVICLKSFFVIS